MLPPARDRDHRRDRRLRGRSARVLTTLLILVGTLLSCTSSTPDPSDLEFDGERAYRWVVDQCELGYRITGSEASLAAGDMFVEHLESVGWETREQRFTYMDTPVRNILAWKGEGPGLLIGAHYDTRRRADEDPTQPTEPVLGANDGASGVAVLLELARTLAVDETERTVYLAFFDAEDNGRLNGWEWIVGSSHMAAHWGDNGEAPLQAAVIVDMIGDRDQNIYYERNSDPTLSQTLWGIAADLGYGNRFIAEPGYSILDDHTPFLRQGIPAVDIIDFDYPYWHTTEDTPDKVSPDSLEAVGRTVEVWLETYVD